MALFPIVRRLLQDYGKYVSAHSVDFLGCRSKSAHDDVELIRNFSSDPTITFGVGLPLS